MSEPIDTFEVWKMMPPHKSGEEEVDVFVQAFTSKFLAYQLRDRLRKKGQPAYVQKNKADPAYRSRALSSNREVAWLIERNRENGACWYGVDGSGWHDWTRNANTALRFDTKAEAAAFLAGRMHTIASDPTISITEHVFLSRAQPAPSGETK